MEHIVDILVRKLSDKGVFSDEVPWLIRDVLNTVDTTGEPGVKMVNQRLEILGWDKEILDEVTFALIICLAEKSTDSTLDAAQTERTLAP